MKDLGKLWSSVNIIIFKTVSGVAYSWTNLIVIDASVLLGLMARYKS